MKESKQDELNEKIADFFQNISREYGTGCGMLALDLSRDGSVVLGMMFGKKSQLSNRIIDRLDETCQGVIKGARIEYEIADEDIVLPDPTDRKAMAEFILKHDLLGDDGQVDRKKADALFDKLIEQKKKQYIDDFLKARKDED